MDRRKLQCDEKYSLSLIAAIKKPKPVLNNEKMYCHFKQNPVAVCYKISKLKPKLRPRLENNQNIFLRLDFNYCNKNCWREKWGLVFHRTQALEYFIISVNLWCKLFPFKRSLANRCLFIVLLSLIFLYDLPLCEV